ncbi:MAG: AAA family ATPase [Erysipelothrix sp.]|nr:AAA family ATPase [Erysipelothrix sp.]
MFLKKIEIQGFKSFADKKIINFDSNITGVVGPNGCGKSNIAEAIRWVLGEQSTKSLRSETMSDVIFNGSAKRKMVNIASVTLVFDNSRRSLPIDFDEVSVSRKYNRHSSVGEYFINNAPVRLKDILDLIADSGIGKDSLSMISQGNISSFAESKPIDRRSIFEEAAGVAKYKKRKNESFSKLTRTQENISRVNDIVFELEKQVNPLRRAAKKAQVYVEKKTRLEAIEITVLVKQIQKLRLDIETFEQELFDLTTQTTLKSTHISVEENHIQQLKGQINLIDREIAQLQDDLMKAIHEIQTLETRKIELDEKRKYILETGSDEEKLEQIKLLLHDSKIEYDDRVSRKEQLMSEINETSRMIQELNRNWVDLQANSELTKSRLNRLENKEVILQNTIDKPFIGSVGVNAIISAKHSLTGIIDVVSSCIEVKSGYEIAISTALGAASNHIVTKDDEAAKNAIKFLKRNESGRATFIPLNVLKRYSIHQDQMIIAKATEGFLGVASDFVEDKVADGLLSDSFLGNTLVVDSIDHANHLSKLLQHNVKIVTLDGDIIHRGGSMTGGKNRDHHSQIEAKHEIQLVRENIITLKNEFTLISNQFNEHQIKRQKLEETLLNLRLSNAQIEPVIEAKRAKYERLLNEYDQLSSKDETLNESFEETLITSLNQQYSHRDEIRQLIESKRENKVKLTFDLERKDKHVLSLRREFVEISSQEKKIEIELTRMKTQLDGSLNRLSSDYSMTYEYASTQPMVDELENAQDEVAKLRAEIQSLGNINMDAPTEFEAVNERYEFLTDQLAELNKAKKQLEDLIHEMDQIMIERFSQTFNAINQHLPEVFASLFGGGKARLVLEDPNDLLNTGIDIDVAPPGKTIQNIRLFSGGEKSLIAISVLFAILKTRHVPLCVFDEVEAALDQANVERFAKYLKKFAQDTQFIVITHRPGTMAMCDNLYGVTMPEDGVSDMLQVKLLDAMTLAEPSGGVDGVA